MLLLLYYLNLPFRNSKGNFMAHAKFLQNGGQGDERPRDDRNVTARPRGNVDP